VYGLLDEIVLRESDEAAEAEVPAATDNGRESGARATAAAVDPALLRGLGVSPDDVAEHNRHVRAYQRRRHLSRFERQFRWENGLDVDMDMEIDEEEGEEEGRSASGGGRADGSVGSNNNNMEEMLGIDDDTGHHSPHHIDDHHQHQHIRRNLLVNTPYTGVHPYQTTPLSQGYGTHYATVYVGTPPQRKSVIVDTGSHYTAFPCAGCTNCGEEHRELFWS
jgi:hypothetical protein